MRATLPILLAPALLLLGCGRGESRSELIQAYNAEAAVYDRIETNQRVAGRQHDEELAELDSDLRKYRQVIGDSDPERLAAYETKAAAKRKEVEEAYRVKEAELEAERAAQLKRLHAAKDRRDAAR